MRPRADGETQHATALVHTRLERKENLQGCDVVPEGPHMRPIVHSRIRIERDASRDQGRQVAWKIIGLE